MTRGTESRMDAHFMLIAYIRTKTKCARVEAQKLIMRKGLHVERQHDGLWWFNERKVNAAITELQAC